MLALAVSAAHGAAAVEPAASPKAGDAVAGPLSRFARLKFGASLSLNWRNVGPRRPGYETQIQNEVFLADMFFGLEGPFFDEIPFIMEWHIPTGSQGRLRLNQLAFTYNRLEDFSFQFGKFVVPFGRYNELYKPDQFLTVTRPLLYASPDSLDLVVRPNSPRPPFTSGYTDIGARASYYPPTLRPWIPSEITLFVVNGLSESTNRQRTFPDPANLGIENPPTGGVHIDFGHNNNNLADNNNHKAAGGRLVFAVGDVRLPWPFPEESADVTGFTLGFSGMGTEYDLEGELTYQMFGLDFSFDYKGVNFSGEYLYGDNYFLTPLASSSTTLVSPTAHVREREQLHGYFVQASYPIMRRPPIGKRLTGILVYNQMFRRGPLLEFLLNYNDSGTVIPSLTAIQAGAHRLTRSIDKYTAALNWQVTDNMFVKFDYSYWVMGQSTVRSSTSLGLVDIYQGAFSVVASF